MPASLTQVTQVAPLHQPLQWLVGANQVLTVSSEELLQLVKQEVAENPALELEEYLLCPSCGQVLRGSWCPTCSQPATASITTQTTEQDGWLEPPSQVGIDTGPSALAEYLPAPVSLAEHLQRTLQAELPAAATPIIEYLVGCLDEHGYFRGSLEEATQFLRVAPAEVADVLTHLQAQEPAGIGARDVRECLLLQLRAMEAADALQQVAMTIIDRFLTELGRRQYDVIARQLSLARWQVEQAHAWIQHWLTPFPVRDRLEATGLGGQEQPRPLIPDVIIRRQPARANDPYTVEVVEARRFSLRLSDAYAQAYRERPRPQRGSPEEREHIEQAVVEARFFLASLKHRWKTLGRITEALVQLQQAYLEQGVSALQPLTRTELATELGLHPSTVSRATADKYVLLPTTEVVPLATFFSANLPVKAAVRELIEQTSPPLSDQRLVGLLAERGLQVARRTVAKYRAQLGIEASSKRRSLSAARRPMKEAMPHA